MGAGYFWDPPFFSHLYSRRAFSFSLPADLSGDSSQRTFRRYRVREPWPCSSLSWAFLAWSCERCLATALAARCYLKYFSKMKRCSASAHYCFAPTTQGQNLHDSIRGLKVPGGTLEMRSEEHTSELQSHSFISY